ncbi:MAG: nucleotidyltransferase [Cyanobacteria bacterium SW_9_44_58]|nr:MAG: nucleotidyltransferase [Cyanobacteria bacterium SW_9_44_58]
MLTQEQLIKQLQKEYPHLVTEYGVKNVGIFGSYAKGIPTETSDIDLIIEFEYPIGFKFIELVEYLENVFGKKVDILTPAGIQAMRLDQVAQDITNSIVYV